MPLDENVRNKIFDHFKKSYLTQEAQVRGEFKDYKFSKDEIEHILQSLSIDEEMINIDREKLQIFLTKPIFSRIGKFNYQSEENEKKVINELEFYFNFVAYLSKEVQISLVFIGDIKGTDEYIWVYSDEIEKIDFFPIHWVESTFEEYSRTNPFLWWKHFPFPVPSFIDITPFHPAGKKVTEDNIQRVRDFFEQVVNGVGAKIDVMRKIAKLGGLTTINIVIPVLIISSVPAFISKLPILEKSNIKEDSSILYLYNPTAVPTINLWRIPILVIEQSKALDTIKKLTVAVFAQLSSRSKTEKFTKK